MAKWLLLLTIFPLQLVAQMQHQLTLGDSTITFVDENNSSESPILFVNVHENEYTSIEAVRAYDVQDKYRFVYLKHNGLRRISFNDRGVVYSVDPNRIFSSVGIVATLAYDSLYSKRAERISKHLAAKVLRYLSNSRWVISLHNNTPDNYSILSYLPGQPEAPNTKDVFVNELMDPDDFIYTTDEYLFSQLKLQGINVILQDNENCVDDGSLSVWCGKHGVPYANVEAEEGHLTEQIDLIAKIVAIIEPTLQK